MTGVQTCALPISEITSVDRTEVYRLGLLQMDMGEGFESRENPKQEH